MAQLSRKHLVPLVEQKCYYLNFDPNLVLAMIEVESSRDPTAETPYARGLMQVSKIALEQINKDYVFNFTYNDMFDPDKNLTVGILYFKWLYNYFTTRYGRCKGLAYAVYAYNWGIGNVLKWLSATEPNNAEIAEIPTETAKHFAKFLWWLEFYESGRWKEYAD